jgi:hypothetical protein
MEVLFGRYLICDQEFTASCPPHKLLPHFSSTTSLMRGEFTVVARDFQWLELFFYSGQIYSYSITSIHH